MNGVDSMRISIVLLSAWLCACLGPQMEASCRLREADGSVLRKAAPFRAHVRLVSSESDERLDVVVQRRADELVVVGFTHYGVRLFSVRQRGGSVRVEDAPSARHETVAFQVLDALRRGWAPSGSPQAGAGEVSLIRYAGSHGGNGFEIRAPQCGYEASVVGVSGTRPAWRRDAPEGVEP